MWPHLWLKRVSDDHPVKLHPLNQSAFVSVLIHFIHRVFVNLLHRCVAASMASSHVSEVLVKRKIIQ